MGLIPGVAQWVKGSGVDVAVAVAQIQALARELPYARGMAIQKIKTKTKPESKRI